VSALTAFERARVVVWSAARFDASEHHAWSALGTSRGVHFHLVCRQWWWRPHGYSLHGREHDRSLCIEGLLSKSTIGNRMPMKAAPSARYPT